MKIVTVIGARPQFVKAAAVSRVLRQRHAEILVHTGQHYDYGMSQIFFDELNIPTPDYHLGVGSGQHGAQTGAMLAGIEKVLLAECPDRVLVYGDTNSTLAGALAAAKLQIPVAHIEAGLRSFNRAMPEEINRVLTDHIADRLFCPSQGAIDNLAQEGIREGVLHSGDIMFESLQHALSCRKGRGDILRKLGLSAGNYWVVTLHRAENVNNTDRMHVIVEALNALSQDVRLVFSVHPGTRKQLGRFSCTLDKRIQLIDPLGYVDAIALVSQAEGVLTDSGGLQKEAFWLKVPCVTLRRETEWLETITAGWNCLAGERAEQIVACVRGFQKPDTWRDLYDGQGSVARIVESL